MGVDPSFLRFVENNLDYWLRKVEHLDEQQIRDLDSSRRRLYNAIEYALSVPQLAPRTAALIRRLFRLIDQRGYWNEWAPILDQAVKLPDLPLVDQVKLANHRGLAYTRLKRNAQAIAIQLEALALATATGDPEIVMRSTKFLANAYYAANQYEQARKYAHAVIEGGLENVDTCYAYHLLGNIAIMRGVNDEAIALLARALQYQHHSEPSQIASIYNSLGWAHQNSGALQAALVTYDQALAIYNQTSARIIQLSILLNKSSAYLALQQPRLAEQQARLALETAALSTLSPVLYTQHLTNLGSALRDQQRFDEALIVLQQACHHWREIGDELNLGNAVGVIGILYGRLGNMQRAVELLDESIDLLIRNQINSWARETLDEMRAARRAIEEDS